MNLEKNNLEFQDHFVESVLQHTDHGILTPDFEKQIMQKIHANHSYKKEVISKLKKSLFYFFSGISLILLFPIVSIIQRVLFHSSINILSIVILFLSIILGVIFITNYKRWLQSVTT